MFIAGDIGGTKVRLASYRPYGRALRREVVKTYESKAFPSFGDILNDFVAECRGSVEAVCVGVAGPVSEGRVKVTNLPWELSEAELANAVGTSTVKLVNDLAATASAVPHLVDDEFLLLFEGTDHTDDAVSAVVAPGTGLGHAAIHRVDGKNIIIPSEGSHIDFAPRNEEEDRLLQYMRRVLKKRVSVERLVSGPGITHIYNFLKESKFAPETPSVAERFVGGDQSGEISNAAMSGECPLCERTLDLFVSLLGSHCGNIVLTFICFGGLYLGGGIPPKIQSKLSTDNFYSSYRNKGRLSPLVEGTPVYLIRDDFAALNGAAHIAFELGKD